MPDVTTSEKLLVLDKEKSISAVFTKNKPANLSEEELAAISELETMGCSFYWPTDIDKIPQTFDLSFLPEEGREHAKKLLEAVRDYLHFPAIVDPYVSNGERCAFKNKFKNRPKDPIIEIYLRNCLRHHMMNQAISSVDFIGFYYLDDGNPKKTKIEAMTNKMRFSVDKEVMKETPEVAANFRELTFEALQLFSAQAEK